MHRHDIMFKIIFMNYIVYSIIKKLSNIDKYVNNKRFNNQYQNSLSIKNCIKYFTEIN